MTFTTIAAIATPIGKGGIGIIKLSGPEAIPIVAAVFQKSGSSASTPPFCESFESHRIYHGRIVDPGNGQVIDEVLVSVMKAPRSYTREDIVEINAHGGQLVLSAILELVLSKGARLAEPGEFTKRAFLNGRIDLTRAEGVIDIITARTQKALQIASDQLKGGLGDTIGSIRETLLASIAEIEAEIDFPEDVGELSVAENIRFRLETEVLAPMVRLLNGYFSAHIYRDGVKLAVVGRPNVGKSSLVNRLIQKDRVIVTPIPGTTRDLIEESLEIHGVPVTITDTAGLHATDDPVEVIGIEKTRACIRDADLVFFLVDAGAPLTGADFEIYDTLEGKPALLIINKMDLLADPNHFQMPVRWKIPSVMTSALYNQGIEQLKALFAKTFIRNGGGGEQHRTVPNLRHKMLLESGVKAVESALKGFEERVPEALIAIDLKQGIDALDEIIGKGLRPTILDEIFSRFCIGK